MPIGLPTIGSAISEFPTKPAGAGATWGSWRRNGPTTPPIASPKSHGGGTGPPTAGQPAKSMTEALPCGTAPVASVKMVVVPYG